MTDALQWFYADGSEERGPVSVSNLRTLIAAGSISGDTLVWCAAHPERVPFRLSVLASPGPAALGVPVVSSATPPLTFVEAVRTCFQKYIDFTGRTKRSEYWYFVLFTVLGSAILTVVEDIVSRGETHFLAPLFSLAVLLPSLAVLVRRLHDTDRSGWWAFLTLFPVIGNLVLIWFCVQPSAKGTGRFG